MSRRKKTFYDVYSELWELLDKPRLKFWQRMRAKVAEHEEVIRQYEFYVWHNMKFFEESEK